MRKTVIKIIGLLWCIVLFVVMTKMFNPYKVNAVKDNNTDDSVKVSEITFNDKETEKANYTGLLNEKIEDKLNNEGIFDFEIERLSKEDIDALNNSDIKYLTADKQVIKFKGLEAQNWKYSEALLKEEDYISSKEIMGKTIKLNGWNYIGISSIVYASDATKNEVGLISLFTCYNMPNTTGIDLMKVSNCDETYVKDYKTYAVYDSIESKTKTVKIDKYNKNLKTYTKDNAVYKDNFLRAMSDNIKNASNITYVISETCISEVDKLYDFNSMAGYQFQIKGISSIEDLYDYVFSLNPDGSFSSLDVSINVVIENIDMEIENE